MTTTLYGITNCDSVKKARTRLKEAGADYQFCDFKKTPPDAAQIGRWLQQIELAQLVNKRGTTWRKLSAAEQAQAASEAGAIALMAAHPSLIKRPLLEHNGQLYCGFDEALYQSLFQAA